MNSFDLTKFRNQLLKEKRIVENKPLKEALNLDPSSPQIGQYWDIMVKNQPDDVVKILTNLSTGEYTYKDFLSDTENDIYDSFRDDEIDYEDEDFSDPFIDGELEEGTLEEMAKIVGDLKSSIEAVMASNPELEGLALKKTIKSDPAVINALAGESLHDNQLNRFIEASKGERTVGQRGRKADLSKPEVTPKLEKSPKIKITNPKTEPTSKLSDLAPSSLFGGEADEEEMDMEKQAMKAAKGNKRLGTTIEKLAQVTKEMKALAKEYQASKGTPEEANIIAQLKALTAEKKALEKKTSSPKQMSAADLMGGEEL